MAQGRGRWAVSLNPKLSHCKPSSDFDLLWRFEAKVKTSKCKTIFLSVLTLCTLCSMVQSTFCNSEKYYTYGPVFGCITPAEHIGWFVFRVSQMCSRFTRHHPSQRRSIWWNDPHEGTGSKAGTRAQQNQSKDTLTSCAWKQNVFTMDRGLNSGFLVNDG